MAGAESFIFLLLALGWIIFQVIQRVRRPPRPLGTIRDEADTPAASGAEAAGSSAPGSPWDVGWGREPDVAQAPPPVPDTRRRPKPERVVTPPVRTQEHSEWLQRLETSRVDAARPRRRAPEAMRRGPSTRMSRHPHRPSLRTLGELRDAVVLAAVIGPCRATEAWRVPDDRA